MDEVHAIGSYLSTRLKAKGRRPSDVLYFAHRNYVIGSTEEEARHKAEEEKELPPEEAGMEWRSFRSLPRGDLGGILKPAEK